MVSVLAMAALAIDLTTLYVARGEIQRAADAAALAGAKAFVDSGVTTNPSSPTLQNMATTMAGDFATAVLSQNKVAGATPQFINGNPTVSLTFSIAGIPASWSRCSGPACRFSLLVFGETPSPRSVLRQWPKPTIQHIRRPTVEHLFPRHPNA